MVIRGKSRIQLEIAERVCTGNMCVGVSISKSKHDNWHLFGRYASMPSTLSRLQQRSIGWVFKLELLVWLTDCVLIINVINTRKSVQWILFSTQSKSRERVWHSVSNNATLGNSTNHFTQLQIHNEAWKHSSVDNAFFCLTPLIRSEKIGAHTDSKIAQRHTFQANHRMRRCHTFFSHLFPQNTIDFAFEAWCTVTIIIIIRISNRRCSQCVRKFQSRWKSIKTISRFWKPSVHGCRCIQTAWEKFPSRNFQFDIAIVYATKTPGSRRTTTSKWLLEWSQCQSAEIRQKYPIFES